MWDITIHPPWESDALVGTLAPHGRVALIPLTHPRTHSAVTRYCPLWADRPSRFCFRQLRSSFPVGHPSWDCSSINMFNLGVPIPYEAAEPPKGLALDWRWACTYTTHNPSPLADVGYYNFSVAMSGYWAFGNQAMGTLLYNFMGVDKPLLPTWFLVMTNVFTLLQVLAVIVVYLQPTNEVFEKKFADPKMDQFSVRNVVPRLIFRSLTVVVATFFAAMLPFFGDIMALVGAFGCIPLDFILPMIFYNVSFKPSKQSLIFWVNTLIAGVSFLLVGVGAVASVRQIFLDAKTYRLFANM
ncbi:hypothetical protein ACLB2K_072697 [Fragaria x ananassa]